ncbi:hypothetical protein WJX74_008431 [Apatococcus lobatus]|uniref:Zinc finger PHD-type domain-containing protein n=1 Tax=Apatococcus lobatus TaxID=904363 RepID=A0AAW1SFT5_9CHLO
MSSPTPEDQKIIRAILASETSQDRPVKRRRKLVKAKEVQKPAKASADSKPTSSPAPSQQDSRLSATSCLDAEPDEASEAVSTANLGDDQEGGEIDQRANDAICVACDDGGEILLCDGPCMRSFHANADCNILGIPPELLKVLQESSEQFLCPLCLAGIHRCYTCQQLACSQDGELGARELYRCAVATCGRFYHPSCLGQTPMQADDAPFACPLHKCKSCGSEEDGQRNEIVPCRRCPTAYHQQCAPKSLRNGDLQRIWIQKSDTDGEEGIAQSLLYCDNHVIPDGRDTPGFEKAIFPKKLLQPWKEEYARQNPDLAWAKPIIAQQVQAVNSFKQKHHDGTAHSSPKPKPIKTNHALPSIAQSPLDAKPASLPSELQQHSSSASTAKAAAVDTTPLQTDSMGMILQSPKKVRRQLSPAHKSKAQPAPHLAQRIQPSMPTASDISAEDGLMLDATLGDSATAGAAREEASDLDEEPETFSIDLLSRQDLDTERQMVDRALALDSEQITLRIVSDAARRPKPYDVFLKRTVDEGRLQAFRGSIKLAESNRAQLGHALSDQAVKELYQIEDNLRRVNAPMLQKERYTSYGRHFTKAPQMEAVATRLLDFLSRGDTVVDFSCGSNEFVPMVKRMALAAGIEVFGRAYDIITARHFEDLIIKSWFETTRDELPPGDQTVIGLNPPFGTNGSLANQFIEKAASFNPRIIVLVVPPQTVIPGRYIVQFEDNKIMADKAFYIPGGDKAGIQQSWNVVTPAVRILVRRDRVNGTFSDSGNWFTRHTQAVASEFARQTSVMMRRPPPLQAPMPFHLLECYPMMPMPMPQGHSFPG